MRALIIDDHTLFRDGFALLLRGLAPDIELEQAATVADAMPKLQAQTLELAFLDWYLPGTTGAEALDALRSVAPTVRFVILSGERSQKVVDLAIGRGACGFIPKEASTDELTSALQLILRGGIYLPPSYLTSAGKTKEGPQSIRSLDSCFPELTKRQTDVFRSALRGHGNKQIARELGISFTTVATHLVAVYGAIGVRNRTEAVFVAAKRGALID